MLSDRDFFVLPPHEGMVDYGAVFGNANPVYIEIGSGKGEFISQYPTLYPDANFLGFEVREKRIRNILKKLDTTRNPNVRLMVELVDEGIRERLPAESVEGVFIQHPDPWPKRRHHRRRLIQPVFLEALAYILKKDGFVQISTDHAEYATWIEREFAQCPLFKPVFSETIQNSPHLENHVVTWFEEEQRRQGYEPQFMFYHKV
ncbi:MAG: tRNA (guanosine(46)-N7)-methyltransferase TrmB [Candidatus Cloacimonetes bacterium]|nr:tRNA (guanosine(46)-N7)-methyltransferase TrmB [Candidatus Cloacimonadota bacterium]